LALLPFLLIIVPTLVRADEDDAEKIGDLQPVAPSGQYQVPNYQNYGHNDFAHALSPDGKLVAITTHGNWVMLHDLVRRKQPQQPRQLMLENMQLYNAPIVISPDGQSLVATGQQHSNDMAVHFVDIKTGKEIRQIDNDQPLFGLALSPDGKHLAVGVQQGVELWDAATGDEVRVINVPPPVNFYYPTRPLCFSHDGRMIAIAMGNTVHVCETASGKERFKFAVGSDAEQQQNMRIPRNYNVVPVGALGFSADGRLLAVGGDRSVRVWDLMAGLELPPLGSHQGMVRALVFTADGKRLISFDTAGLKLTWNVARIVKSANAKLTRLSDRDFEELWDELGDADAFNTYRALRHMTADPARTLALLTKHVQPVPPGDSARLEKLVADLQNASSGVRRKAMTELRKHGEAALGALTQIPQAQRNHQSVNVLMNKLEMLHATPERARALKAVQVLEQIGTPEAKQLLDKLAKGAAGTKLTVAAKTALEHLGETGDQTKPAEAKVEALWSDLGSDDAAIAYRALCRLTAAPRPAIALLREQLKPATGVDEKRLDQLITDLDNNQFDIREKATAELEAAGDQASPLLKKTLEGSPSVEVRKRVERLLERLNANQAPSGKTLRAWRAVELLEHLDTGDARLLLESLARGAAHAPLTKEAKASLDRLAKRTTTAVTSDR
jgi:WD40 repeat protein